MSMQLLQPLTVVNIGFLSSHILVVAGIDQGDLQLISFQYFIQCHPVIACCFHGYMGDACLLQLGCQGMQVSGESIKCLYGLYVVAVLISDIHTGTAYINTRSTGINNAEVEYLLL